MWGDKAMQLRSKETTNNKNRHSEESEIKNNSKWFLSDSNKISELEDKSKRKLAEFPKTDENRSRDSRNTQNPTKIITEKLNYPHHSNTTKNQRQREKNVKHPYKKLRLLQRSNNTTHTDFSRNNGHQKTRLYFLTLKNLLINERNN